MTINSWVKLLLDPKIMEIVIDSIRYCQANKGLKIYAYCLMPDHIHMVCRSSCEETLSSIVRDFKKFTSNEIMEYLTGQKTVEAINLLNLFRKGIRDKSNSPKFSIWKRGFNPIELSSTKFIDQKIDYIHANPVKAGLVKSEIDYLYSSARDMEGIDGEIKVVVTFGRWKTYR